MELYGVGVRRRRRRRGELVAKKLLLNFSQADPATPPGTKIADITNKISTSTLTLLDSNSGRFSLVGNSIFAGTTPIGSAQPVRYITIVETQPNGVQQRSVIGLSIVEGVLPPAVYTPKLDFTNNKNSGYIVLL